MVNFDVQSFLFLQDPSSGTMDSRRVLWNQWRHPKCDDYDPSGYRGGKSPVVITKLSIEHYKQNNFAKLRVCILNDFNFDFNFWTHLSGKIFAYGIWTGIGFMNMSYILDYFWLFCRFLLWMMRLRKLQERLRMMVCYTFYTCFIPLKYWHLWWKIAKF